MRFTFNPGKKGLRRILGDLETEIMELLWANGEMSVRTVHGQLEQARPIAYTTVMTVMSRLAEKQLLTRRKDGAAFFYSPTHSREEFTASVVNRIVTGLLADFATPAINHFIDSIRDADPSRIAELEKQLKARRKRR